MVSKNEVQKMKQVKRKVVFSTVEQHEISCIPEADESESNTIET